jgi:nitroreductase
VDKTDLYSTIFKRKSIRRFQPTQLDEATLAELTNTFNQINPLIKDIKTELKILPENTVKGLFAVKAPHYLAIYSEEKEGYLTNAGFILQQLDLHLSANNLGSCWLGVAKPSKEKLVDQELKFVITLAFGKPAETLHRNNVGEFKRLPLDQIRDAVGMDDILEPARLAPSANNSQRWYFTGGDGKLNVYIGNSLLQNRWSLIDAGIAICHIWIAVQHQGKQIEQVKDLEAARKRINRKSYVTSLRVY